MSSAVALFSRNEFIILSLADHARIASSPRDIHFWIYDDVTDNCILDLQEKIEFATLCAAIILVSFIYRMRPRVICKRTSEEHVKQKKDGVRLCNAEKDLLKVN